MTAKRRVIRADMRPGLILVDDDACVQAIVLSGTPIGEDDNEYPVLAFHTRSGTRLWPGGRSSIRPGAWYVAEALLPIDTDLLMNSVPIGLNESCTMYDQLSATGMVCQHCGGRTSNTCDCGICEDPACAAEVEQKGDFCDECLTNCSNEMYCSVCDDSDADHDASSHEWCTTCDTYIDHGTDDCPNKEAPADPSAL